MSTTSYNITLQTIHVSTKKPIGNLRIEVWDKDATLDDFLVQGTTDKAGNAKIQFTSERFREVFGDQSPDLYFKVYRGDKLVADTEGQIMWNVGKKTSKIIIAVNEDSSAPETTSYNITVQTVDVSTKKPIGNLRIEVWDKDRVGDDDFLAQGTTDKAGNAQIHFTSDQFTEVSGDRSTPDLYFKVYRGDKLVADTEGQVMWNIRKKTSKITIAVNESCDVSEVPVEKVFSVSGTVLLANGRAASGVTVKVFHQGLSADPVLGTVTTSLHGAYRLVYTPALKGAHVFIRVYDPADESQVLRESAVTYYAKEETVIDLQLLAGKEAGLSLFETIAQLLLPELQKLRVDTLTDKQLILLSRTVAMSFDVLAQYRQAFILYTAYSQLPSTFFFALITSGISVGENQWKTESVASITHALQEAQRNHFVPEIPVQTLEAMLQAFQAIRARHHMEDALLANDTNLQDLLVTSGVAAASQQKIAALYADHAQRPDIFWATLLKDKELVPHAEKLKRSFSFHRLTLGNIPLTKKLFADNSISSLRSMAAWDSETWKTKLSNKDIVDAIPAQFPGETPESRKAAYAMYLSRVASFLYPTEAVAGRIQSDNQLDTKSRSKFNQFFSANPAFRIETHSVDAYLADHPGALDAIDDGEAFGQQLYHLSMQFALAPASDKYAGMRRLAKMKISSPSGVIKKSQKKFTDDFKEQGGTESEAFAVYNTAGRILSEVQALKLNHGYGNAFLPYVISATVKDDEVWELLFGAEDYCSCRHCRSLFGPAAYLTDLLAFLHERGRYPDGTVLEVLEERRPDIGNILLNCTNAETAMPYIDLVNEILENAIVPVPDLRYQTTGSTDDLLVLPEHLNEAAYISLAHAVYPWTLPFDLFTETGRMFLTHAGVRHDELIRLFASPADSITYVNAVLELLPVDRTILVAKNAAYQEAAWWGVEFPPSGDLLVEVVLDKSGLRFAELQELRRTKFINPLNEIQINDDGNCSLTGATISKLNKSDRRKILQFSRLKSRIKLTIRETDQLLFALQCTEEITDDVLSVAAQLSLVRRRLSISPEQILAWWGRIPTVHPADDEGSQQLYERIFLNKTIQQRWQDSGPGQSAAPFEGFLLTDERNELINPVDVIIPENFSYLAAALETSADELSFMLTQLNKQKLYLADLSKLYGMKSMSSALRCSVQDLYALIELSGIDPFVPASTIQFLNALDQLRKNGWSIAEAGFVLRHDRADEFTWATEKFRTVIADLYNLVRDAGTEADIHVMITHRLATLVELPPAVAGLLLIPGGAGNAYLNAPAQAGVPLISSIISTLQLESEEPHVVYESQLINGLLLLQKAAWVIRKFNLPDSYIGKWLVKTQTEFLHLGELPVQTGVSNSHHLWAKLADMLTIRSLHKKVITTEFTLLDVPSKENIVLAFESDVAEQDAVRKFLMQRNDLSSVAAQARFVYDVCIARKTLGIRIHDYMVSSGQPANPVYLLDLARTSFDASLARRIEAIAKSKYNPENWRSAATELRNQLRSRQRDKLSSYLVATRKNGVTSLEDLYAYYLVDVEMGSCMRTSRIRLALSSVQLFVQRCLMGLETEVDLSQITDDARVEWEEWNWRKNYRVWEANRKIFLYPENWLEPEWRDDKTQFFTELENELQQNELDSQYGKKVFGSYLQKFDKVANLEIIAFCQSELLSLDQQVYYMFGRTQADPREVYYRKFIKEAGSSYFTSWEKIDVDIEGDKLVPVIRDGRMFLFWPVFKMNSKSLREKREGYDGVAGNEKYWHIHLAHTEYEDGTWSNKKVSESFLNTDADIDDPTYQSILEKNGMSTIFPQLKNNTLIRYNRFNRGQVELQIFISADYKFTEETWVYVNKTHEHRTIANYDFKTGILKAGTFILKDSSEITFNKAEGRFILPVGIEGEVKPTGQGFEVYSSVLAIPGGASSGEIILGDVPPDRFKVTPLNTFQLGVLKKPFIHTDSENQFLIVPDATSGSYDFVLHNIKNRYAKQFLVLTRSNNIDGLLLNSIVGAAPGYYFKEEDFSGTNLLNGYVWSAENVLMNERPPLQRIGFSAGDAYSQYNWEIFFHIPMLVATRLSQEQRYEEARDWFHYVFNPTSTKAGNAPDRFWNFRPFLEYNGLTGIRELLESPEHTLAYHEFAGAVALWEQNPFNPHAVGRTRIVAYMKWVVMKYIDNLIEWADLLFRQDTMESLNEATQLYMLAWNILGRSPEELPGNKTEDKTFNNIRYDLDPLSNAFVDVVEERIASAYTRTEERQRQSYHEYISLPSPVDTEFELDLFGVDIEAPEPVIGRAELYIMKTLYFCIPPNDKLLGYWKLLGDRFFKLRNCQNISGQVRMLPLYEPPIDPALLIRASQAGLSISEALSMNSIKQRPHYRFGFMIQKAIDYASDVRVLGGALLATMEKQDAEELHLLRSQHEQTLLNAVLQNRKLQVDEAQESLAILQHSLGIAQKKQEYYSTKQFMSSGEITQMVLMALVNRMQLVSQGTHQLSALEKGALTFYAGFAGMGGVAMNEAGGKQLGGISDSLAEAFSKMASILNVTASEIGQVASYERRYEDWMHQADIASEEVPQVERQLIAAEIRLAIAEHELQNHELQIVQAQEQNEMMVSKFSNKELYRWMIEQIKMLYNQSYQAAVEIALKAEVALKFELPALKERSFIKFGYWDNLKAGLLSGEKLHHDLKQMEMAYIANNKRLFEISKTVSLGMISANELVNLKNIGQGKFTIPEALFNLDFPTHAGKLRRIKAVSLSVPCVTGPYTGVNCILSTTAEGVTTSIATSSGQNDTGIFQFNFGDERYLPFEGMPVNCEWTIDMNPNLHAFDFGSISDVLLHIHYTVDPDLDAPAEVTARHTSDANTDSGSLPLTRYISLRNEFADEWIRFKNNPQPNLEIPVTEKLFPYMFRQEAMDAIGPVTAWTKTGDTYTELAANTAKFISPNIIVTGAGLNTVDDVLLAVKYTVSVN